MARHQMGTKKAVDQEIELKVSARRAVAGDISTLTALYRLLAAEMTGYSGLWALTHGLESPIEETLRGCIADPDSVLAVGEFGGSVFGFVLARTVPDPELELRLGSLDIVFVEADMRELGIGEAMRDFVLGELAALGIRRFDAQVLPGHRTAKNFFEQGGFKARHIIMHRNDHE